MTKWSMFLREMDDKGGYFEVIQDSQDMLGVILVALYEIDYTLLL